MLIPICECFLGVFELHGLSGMLGVILRACLFDVVTEAISYLLLQSSPAASRDRVMGTS
ncbi:MULTISPECIES: hypothetical protein [unclassified Burkholderia]|uniref:hypothetical protein n=1 Tax=unclassified Burkholderia TaxID=2613784 RepID=UPI00142143FE|nr:MULTISPECIES: hypothetical protein [unclassified Burkholderia]